jgi:phosphate:Na+ symporter
MSRDIGRERFGHVRDGAKGALMGYVREVELVEILDGIFKTARRIARSELEPVETPRGA